MEEKLKEIADRYFDKKGNRLHEARLRRGLRLVKPRKTLLNALKSRFEDKYIDIEAMKKIEVWLKSKGFKKFEFLDHGTAAIVLRALHDNGSVKVVRIEASFRWLFSPENHPYQYIRPNLEAVAQPIHSKVTTKYKIEVMHEYFILKDIKDQKIREWAFGQATQLLMKQSGGQFSGLQDSNMGIDRYGKLKVFDLM